MRKKMKSQCGYSFLFKKMQFFLLKQKQKLAFLFPLYVARDIIHFLFKLCKQELISLNMPGTKRKADIANTKAKLLSFRETLINSLITFYQN